MSGKVFHVDNELHQAVKDWCALRNLNMKEWISNTLRAAMSGAPPAYEVVMEEAPPKKVVLEPIQKKPAPVQMEEAQPDNDIWNRAPFWKQDTNIPGGK